MPDLKHKLFKLVEKRLVTHRMSLRRFFRHWHGGSSGIEGWFKVEFGAAIGPKDASLRTGGAGGWRGKGRKCPDFFLQPKDGSKEVPIELKAWGNQWYPGGRNARKKYRGHLLAFLGPSSAHLHARHRQKLQKLDKDARLAPICDVSYADGTKSTLYLWMADLRGKRQVGLSQRKEAHIIQP